MTEEEKVEILNKNVRAVQNFLRKSFRPEDGQYQSFLFSDLKQRCPGGAGAIDLATDRQLLATLRDQDNILVDEDSLRIVYKVIIGRFLT